MGDGTGRRIVGGALTAVGGLMLAFFILIASYADDPPGALLFIAFLFGVPGLMMALMPPVTASVGQPAGATEGSVPAAAAQGGAAPGAGTDAGADVEAAPGTASSADGLLVCGQEVGPRRVCARRPGHKGPCSIERR